MNAALPPTFSGPLCLDKKAVIFDIDGTLADSFDLAFSATNVVLQKNKFAAVTAEEYHYGCRFTTPIRMATHAGLDREKDAEEFNAVGKRLGQEFDDLYIGLVDPAQGKAGFYPGIFDLIQAIPDTVQVGALTNAAVAYAEAVLTANKVRTRFAVVHGADDVAAAKPAPDGLLQCCRELGIAPSEAVYVGDSPSDSAAAQAAGCVSLGVTWGANSPAALAPNSDGMVSSVSQLRALLCPAAHATTRAQEEEKKKEEGHEGKTPQVHVRAGHVARLPAHVLLDRDGVINVDVGAPGVVRLAQLRLLPGVAGGIRRLKAAGCRISIVTNQNAIAKGLLSAGELAEIHTELLTMIAEEGTAETGKRAAAAAEEGGRDGGEEGKKRKRDEERGTEEAIVDAILYASGRSELSPGGGGPGPGLPGFKLKPARDLATAALLLSDTPPQSAALVGDNYRDLVAGLRAGVRGLHLVASSPYGLQARAWLQGGPGAAELEQEMDKFSITEEERKELKELVVVHEGLGACVEWMMSSGGAPEEQR